MVNLIVESVKEKENIQNNLEKVIDGIISNMKKHLGKTEYGSRSNQLITSLYNSNQTIVGLNVHVFILKTMFKPLQKEMVMECWVRT